MASELAIKLTVSYMTFHHSTTAGPRHTGYANQFACVLLRFGMFNADAEFFKRLEQIGWLPSASGVGQAPKHFARLRDHANISNHRPINRHGIPLPLMHDAFGRFVDIFNTGIPTHSDCNFAVDLCKLASEVNSDSL